MSFDLTCLGCSAVLPCEGIPDNRLESLQNPTFPYILECLGNNCQIGPIIYFACCNQLLQAPVPVGSSSGQILTILNSLAAQCFNLQSACGEFPAFPPGTFPTPNNPINLFFNQSQTCKLICPDGNPFTYTVPSGWVVAITQSKANAAAYSIACSKAKSSKFCLSDLKGSPACGVAFSAQISANGNIVTPVTWLVVSGALPAGLTLGGFSPNIDTTLGKTETIQGTPTTSGTFAFTIQCQGSDGLFMQKDYSLTVKGVCAPCDITVATLHAPALYAYWLAAGGSNLWNGNYSNAGSPPPGALWSSPVVPPTSVSQIQFDGILHTSSATINIDGGTNATYFKAAATPSVACYLGTYTLQSWNGMGPAPPGTIIVTL